MGIRQNRSDRGTRHQLLRPEPLTLSLNSILQQRSEPYRISVFYIYRDYPGILIVLIPFWSGMG